MFGTARHTTLSAAMEGAQSEQPDVSRKAMHLVFGVDNTIASTVYGTITVMATIAAYGKAFPDRPWELEALVVSTSVVFWIAHLYAHGLSESISEGEPLRGGMMRSLARRELGILYAAVPPCVVLTLGAVGLFDEPTALWLSLAVGLVTLAVEGARYARLERLGATGTLVAIAANVGLGLLVVVLKVEILH